LSSSWQNCLSGSAIEARYSLSPYFSLRGRHEAGAFRPMMGLMPVIVGPVTLPGEFTPLSGTTEATRPALAGAPRRPGGHPSIRNRRPGRRSNSASRRSVEHDRPARFLLPHPYRGFSTRQYGGHRHHLASATCRIKVTFADFRPYGLGTTAPDKFIYGPPGNKYTFIFSKGVPADTSTRFFFVSTNAREFSATGADLGDAELPGTKIILKVPGPLADHHPG